MTQRPQKPLPPGFIKLDPENIYSLPPGRIWFESRYPDGSGSGWHSYRETLIAIRHIYGPDAVAGYHWNPANPTTPTDAAKAAEVKRAAWFAGLPPEWRPTP